MTHLLLSHRVIRFVFFVERWLLSALFLFLSYEHIDTLRFMILISSSRAFVTSSLIARDAGFLDGVHFEDYARYTLLASFNGLCGVLLLISRKPSRTPTRAIEVVVPLAATFFYLIFNQHIPLPLWMTTPFVPAAWSTSLAAAGLVFSVCGVLFSGYAMSWLGRSLGIVVSVREVVLGGPYRYVRHPIYFGYLFVLAGLFLTACTFRMGVLTFGAVGLLVWRARLEEHLLSAYSPAYREWMKHTAFLWPHFRRSASPRGLGPGAKPGPLRERADVRQLGRARLIGPAANLPVRRQTCFFPSSPHRCVHSMWTGRFQQPTDAQVRAYGESVSFDWRLYPHDIEGSIAHATALAAAGHLTAAELAAITAALREICAEIGAGKFRFSPELEDVHMNIEAALTARIGAAGAKLHTARSRNDQVALDLRLYLRAQVGEIRQAVRALQSALVALGERYPDAVMPGYTHLQRAQPVLFAHHLLAYVEMLARDDGRLADTAQRLDVLPLGSGALAGSTITLDRKLIARQLGFAGISANSMDAVSDRDFACEFLSAAAIIGMHLSRLSEDVILWATSEFHFLVLSDAFTTGSSLMPQKKNPDVAELTRGKTGRLYGNLFRLLTILKGLPMTYNRDLQEDKEAVFDSVDTLKASLGVFAAMLGEATLDVESAARATSDPLLLATDLADYLVRRGVPFRQAHEVIGRLVALTLARNVGFAQLTLADYHAASPAFGDDVYAVLDVRRSLETRTGIGAPSFENVAGQLARWREELGAAATAGEGTGQP